jgi:hypothetical protein
VLYALQAKLPDAPAKQQSPHLSGSLAWATWTIARLGGGTGYDSDGPTGSVAMRDGLERFNGIVHGCNLVRDPCPGQPARG